MRSKIPQVSLNASTLVCQGLSLFYMLTSNGQEWNPYDSASWALEDSSGGQVIERLRYFLGVCAHLGYLPDLGGFESVGYIFESRILYLDLPLAEKEDLFQVWISSFQSTLEGILHAAV